MSHLEKDTYVRKSVSNSWEVPSSNPWIAPSGGTLDVYVDAMPPEIKEVSADTYSMCAVIDGYVYRGTVYRCEKYVEAEADTDAPENHEYS